MEGEKIIEDAEKALSCASKVHHDFVAVAKHVARVVDDSFSSNDNSKSDHRVILVRG
jgi:hypothetical protein